MVVAGNYLIVYGLYHAVAPFSNCLFLRQKLVSVYDSEILEFGVVTLRHCRWWASIWSR